MINLSQSYSPEAITKRFDIIHKIHVRGMPYLALFHGRASLAALVEVEKFHVTAEPQYRCRAILELVARDGAGEAFCTRRYQEDASRLPGDAVTGEAGELATALY
ncbi:hypothetical protein [Chimaeribacter arupi]|uniref:hypothetical protein n=1 Tax=Chimaeribacter arupi TaxID=2060066 RepID=UPI000C7A0BA6|nr:hypothetical protein [Chimaeribacter arupi]PLR53845.1 hypothetical protein CYR52_05080 [Chimaeribacter arupi]